MRVAEPRAFAMRVSQGDIDVKTVPDSNKAKAIAAVNARKFMSVPIV